MELNHGTAHELTNTTSMLSLPPALLQHKVMTLLEPDEIIKLSVCCKQLMAIASSDIIWQPLCDERSWGPFPSGEWMQGFSSRQRLLCVECGNPSRYVFRLLNCRLCDACEHANPKYALITGLEAVQRYGLPNQLLPTFPSVDSCNTKFYLRSSVLQAIAATRQPRTRQGNSGSPSSACQQAEEQISREQDQDDADAAHTMDNGQHEGSDHDSSGSEHELQHDQEQDPNEDAVETASGSQARDLQHEAKRADRKAHKKQAKLEQRLKREAKAAGVVSQFTSSHKRHDNNNHHNGESSNKARGGKPRSIKQASERLTKTSQQAAPRRALLHQGLYPEEDRAAQLLGNSTKSMSQWLQEREAIMREWGQYGISGLVLAE